MSTPLENEDILTIKKDEFMLLANLTKSDEDVKPIEFKGQSLVIKVLCFLKKKLGNLFGTVNREILKQMKNLKMSRGDIIVADISIIQEFDKEQNAWLDKKYELTKFIKHTSRENIQYKK